MNWMMLQIFTDGSVGRENKSPASAGARINKEFSLSIYAPFWGDASRKFSTICAFIFVRDDGMCRLFVTPEYAVSGGGMAKIEEKSAEGVQTAINAVLP